MRLHVKVPGWLLNLNALLTKKLPKFLPRLNEMGGGRENMCLVSGSLRRILLFLRIDGGCPIHPHNEIPGTLYRHYEVSP